MEPTLGWWINLSNKLEEGRKTERKKKNESDYKESTSFEVEISGGERRRVGVAENISFCFCPKHYVL